MDVEAVCRESFSKTYDSATPELSLFEVEIFSHPGENEPEWAWSKQGKPSHMLPRFDTSLTTLWFIKGLLLPNFRHVCTIEANLENLSGALAQGAGARGVTFWSLVFDVCIRFGGTKLEAFLEWEEDVSFYHINGWGSHSYPCRGLHVPDQLLSFPRMRSDPKLGKLISSCSRARELLNLEYNCREPGALVPEWCCVLLGMEI